MPSPSYPSGVQTALASILPLVRVPVLSVHITETEPSVSTDARFFISAFFFAILWLPIASDRVTVGSSPSGTLAIMMPMANRKLCQKPLPIATPSPKKNTPVITAITATTLVALAISFCKGLGPDSTDPVRWAILPNSVDMPVA